MKAIDTVYNGYRFRSRLEARWAIFFDQLGIKYLYEHEGYDLGDGDYYLPDFWLPTFDRGMFAEVKAFNLNEHEMSLACKLVIESKKELMLCIGMPDYHIIYYLIYCEDALYSNTNWYDKMDDMIPKKYLNKIILRNGLPNSDQAEGEDRMYALPGYENMDGSVDIFHFRDGYKKAITAAKRARFEHGETPNQ